MSWAGWACRAGWRAALFAGAVSVGLAAPAPRPNIVFILTDDLGYGDYGVFFQNQRKAANDRGEPWHLTPRLDSMAEQGLQLRHHYCPAPVCAPSRASFLLGVHQGHANVRDNQFDKGLEDNHTVAGVLRQAGYATACIGKWGLQGAGSNAATWVAYPTRRGFDDFYGYVRHNDGHEHYPKEGRYQGAKQVWDNATEVSGDLAGCYTTDLFTARAKKWITDRHAADPAQPFFLFLAYDTPHAVLEYPAAPYPAGGGLAGGLQWLGLPGRMINTATGVVDSYVHPDYAAATYDDDRDPGTPEIAWPEVSKRFATSVNRIDDAVGDLMTLFDDLGIATNTLVVFTSDNGPHNEDYLSLAVNHAPNFFNSFGPFDGIKRDCWEGGIRVGALARWAGAVPAGRISDLPSSFADWMPTFAELAGVPAPARSDGVSLVPTLTGVGAQRRPTVYVEYNVDSSTPSYTEFQSAKRGRARKQMQALRAGDFVGVRYNVTAQADNFEIYNVVTDPQQTNNLAAALPALQQQMKDRVLRLRRPDGDAPRPYDAELVPALGALAVTAGVVWQAHTNAFPWVPEMTALEPATNGVAAAPDLAVRPRDDNIGLLFSGYLQVPTNGAYTFYLGADAGALLRIHEATVADADLGPAAGGTNAPINLAAGRHPFRLYYARGTGGTPSLALEWSGPGIARQAIPAAAFVRDFTGANAAPVAANDAAATSQGSAVVVDVLANDSDDGAPMPLAIGAIGHPAGGTAVDAGGSILYTPNPGFLGVDTFDYTVTDGATGATAKVAVNVWFHDGAYWYPFNQTAGLTTYEAGGGWPATLVNFADAVTPWVAGRYGRGLQFDGTNDYVSIAGFNGVTGTAARTCAAWVNTTATNAIPVIAWGPNTAGRKWTFLVQNGTVRLEVTQGWVQGSRSVNDGQWHHVACTFSDAAGSDVTNVALYVDGTRETTLSSQDPQAIATTSTAAAKIGGDIQGRSFNGVLDEARIYPRALSAAEMASLAAPALDGSAAAWQRRHFGAAVVDWGADADGDGANALTEYAFGGQPLVPDPALARVLASPGAGILFGYTRRATGTHALVYDAESSTNLVKWSSLALPAPTVTTNGDPNLEDVLFQIPRAPDRGVFYRARATLPPPP